MDNCDHFAPLLSGLLDDELTTQERQQLNEHMTRCRHCRDEYERLRQSSDKLSSLSLKEPQENDLQAFWRLPYSGLARRAGMLLLIGGYLCLLVYGIAEFMTDSSEGLFGKLSLAATVIGGVIVFGIVLIERIITLKSDPYKDIER